MREPCPECGKLHSATEIQDQVGREAERLKREAEADVLEIARLAADAQTKYQRCAELFIGEDMSDTARIIFQIIGTVQGLKIYAEALHDSFALADTSVLVQEFMEALAAGKVQVVPMHRGSDDA